MEATNNPETRFATVRRARVAAPASAGFKLMELMIVVALACIMTVVAMPSYQATMHSMHLGSAASSLSSTIESARYLAISSGCNIQVAVSAQTLQVSAQALTGTPPACSAAFTALASGVPLGGVIPFTTANGDVTLTPSTTVTYQFNANGTVTAANTTTPPAGFSLVLGYTNSTGSATKTISVSGMGYVKVI